MDAVEGRKESRRDGTKNPTPSMAAIVNRSPCVEDTNRREKIKKDEQP